MESSTSSSLTTSVKGQIYSLPPGVAGRAITDIIAYYSQNLGERGRDGRLALRELPSATDKNILVTRQRDLLASFKDHHRPVIAALVMDMLASYDVAQIKQLTAAERRAAAVVYVRELAGVPTWAVQMACDKIRLGIAPEISHAFKPTPIQVRVLAVAQAQPWKTEAVRIGEILMAQKWEQPISDEERARVAPKMRLLADELADGVYRDPKSGMGVMDEVEEKTRRETLARIKSFTDKSIMDGWRAAKKRPPEGLLVSRELARKIRASGGE